MTSLCEIKVSMTKISTERKPQLFCKKNGFLLSPKLLEEHKCLVKRTYTNKQGEEVSIICPHATTLKAEAYFKDVYPKEPIFVTSEKEVIAVTPQINVFQKTEENISKIRKAFYELQER